MISLVLFPKPRSQAKPNWSTPYTEELDCKNARYETGGKRIVD